MEKVPELTVEDTMPTAYDPAAVHHLLKNGTRSEILQLLQHKIDLSCTNEDGDTVVHSILRNDKLIEKDILEILTTLHDQNVDLNILNNQEEMGLHLAVKRRMKDTINFLLEFGADLKTTKANGFSIAHFFVKDEYEKRNMAIRNSMMNTLEERDSMEEDSISFLKFLLSKDVDFDRKYKQGTSALHLAIVYKLLHLLPTLLERTNDVKIIDKDFTTLLHFFLEVISQSTNKHPYSSYDPKYTAKCVQILLDRGVPILGLKHYSCTLISNAIKTKEQMNIVEILINYYLKKCIDKNLATTLFYELLSTCAFWNESDIDYFLTVLCHLIHKGINASHELLTRNRFLLTERVTENSVFFDFVKKSGISFSIRSTHDKSLLHMLAEQRNYQGSSDELYNHICDLVLCCHCEVNTINERGESVLQTAIGSGNILMIPILIEFGANVNNQDDSMRTPLHDAVTMDEASEALKTVGLLLSKGANVNAKNDVGDTPLHFAASHSHMPIVELLLEKGASVNCENKDHQTPLHHALASWGNPSAKIVDLLLSGGANVNVTDSKSETPLQLAVSHNNVAIVKLLLDRGASVNCRDKQQQTPLHRVRWQCDGAAEIVESLLKSGADVNAKDCVGKTPLHEAIAKKNLPIVRLLIEHGACVNSEDEDRLTPLHRALRINAGMEIVEFLVKSGADVNAKDREGNRPLHYVFNIWALNDHEDIMTMLLREGAYVNARNDNGESAMYHALSLKNRALVDKLLKYGADFNEDKVRRLMLSSKCPLHQHILQQYVVKLKAADLPFHEDYNDQANITAYEEYQKCLREVVKLKEIFIGDMSLYDFLHERPTIIKAGKISDKLKQLIESPRLEKLFPEYSAIILASYHEAVRRPILLKAAEKVSHELIQMHLPKIDSKNLDDLSNEDLINVIEATIHHGAGNA